MRHTADEVELPTGYSRERFFLCPREPITCTFYIANSGGTVAVVASTRLAFVQAHIAIERIDPEIIRPMPVKGAELGSKIAPGAIHKTSFEDARGLTEATVDRHQAAVNGQPGIGLYIIGHVDYCDENGTRYSIGFVRCYDVAQARFRRMEQPDPDYEYQT